MNTKKLYEIVLSPSFRKAVEEVLKSLNERYINLETRKILNILLEVMIDLDKTLSAQKVRRIREDLTHVFSPEATRNRLKEDFTNIISFLQKDDEVVKLRQKHKIDWQDREGARNYLLGWTLDAKLEEAMKSSGINQWNPRGNGLNVGGIYSYEEFQSRFRDVWTHDILHVDVVMPVFVSYSQVEEVRLIEE